MVLSILIEWRKSCKSSWTSFCALRRNCQLPSQSLCKWLSSPFDRLARGWVWLSQLVTNIHPQSSQYCIQQPLEASVSVDHVSLRSCHLAINNIAAGLLSYCSRHNMPVFLLQQFTYDIEKLVCLSVFPSISCLYLYLPLIKNPFPMLGCSCHPPLGQFFHNRKFPSPTPQPS